MTLTVIHKKALTPDVVQLRLARPDGAALPVFAAGAHLELQVSSFTRRYSITSGPACVLVCRGPHPAS